MPLNRTVGCLSVINYFPASDTVTICREGHAGWSVTAARQKDGSVEIHVQDDAAPAACVFILGSGRTYDPHEVPDEDACDHEPNWSTISFAGGTIDVDCKHCDEAGSFSGRKNDVNW